ncbi:MAG: hypothetical protein JSS30_00330 [Verrucomicrobia bacterium]|nr:hypothetical protein [Verrucomicrobiota bacterium]
MIKNHSFWLLIIFLFLVLSLPQKNAGHLRTWMVGLVSFSGSGSYGSEIEKLHTENQLLYQQLERLKNWILENHQLDKEKQELIPILSNSNDPFYRRRGEYLAKMIYRQMHALPARIVFRDPSPWSSSVWLNVGQRDNRSLGFEVVAKNSPVVIGKTIVGVVEEVTEKRCHVRLITDRSLSPSVRAVRGGEQNRILSEKLQGVIKMLALREDLYGAVDISRALSVFRDQLNEHSKELYLAKGELHGTAAPAWRVPKRTLKGVGFNYDFSDEEGPARNLRTGAYAGGQEPLIKIGDLLVTTGADGIFPPDFHVAIVSKILPLHEGGCSYDLEAEMLAPNLNSLSEVFVLPPL